MKVHNALTDDNGVQWEFTYEQVLQYEKIGDAMVELPTVVKDLQYRKLDEGEWLTLPPWADIHEDWKINLCLFDKDDDGEPICWELIP